MPDVKATLCYVTECMSPLGVITLVSDGINLTGLYPEGHRYSGAAFRGEISREENCLPVFEAVKKWLERYFAGENPSADGLPLAPAGSAFRQGVWDLLREIPYGTLATYGGIAKKMALKTGKARMSARAVGGAVGHNPVSIIIPCHRVVGANGSLTGYGGGIKNKIKLLELEGADISKLFIPKKGTAL